MKPLILALSLVILVAAPTSPRAQQGDPQKGDPQQGAPHLGDPSKGDPQQGEPHRGGLRQAASGGDEGALGGDEGGVGEAEDESGEADDGEVDEEEAAVEGAGEDQGSEGERGVSLGVVGPGCLDRGGSNINLITVLFDWFERHEGSIFLRSSGFSALATENRILVPEGEMSDGTVVTEALAAGAGVRRTVVEEAFPVLVSPYEVNFQVPYAGREDWIRVLESEGATEFPDTSRVMGRLVRWELGERSALMVELPGEQAVPTQIAEWVREFGAVSTVKTVDDTVSLYSIGRQLGRGPRLKAVMDAEVGVKLRISTGDLFDSVSTAASDLRCGQALGAARVDAVVPGPDDLGRGPEELLAWASAHEVPFVAANVALRGVEERPFRRILIKEIDGLRVAVVGVVGRAELARLPPPLRDKWELLDPRMALIEALKDTREKLGARPDLVVVVANAQGDELRQISGVPGVDVLIAELINYDLLDRRTTVEVGPKGARRGSVRYPTPLMLVDRSAWSVTRIDAAFEGAPRALVRLRSTQSPVFEAGPVDEAMNIELRKVEEDEVVASSDVLLPDPAPIVLRNPALEPLVWGEAVLHRSALRKYERSFPARFTDPLWMRLCVNALLDHTQADVAVLRNVQRGFDMVGPLTRLFVRDWLSSRDPVQVHRLSGAALLRVAERVARQETPGAIPPLDYLFAGGLDAGRKRVRGRPIDPGETYLVATTASAAADAGLVGLFGAPDREAGELGALVLSTIESWLDPETRRYRPDAPLLLESLLLDRADKLDGRWTLRLDELSGSASVYTNTDAAAALAETRQTRVTTPDNFSAGGRLNAALVYDGPGVAWENRLKIDFARIVLDIPGQELPPQEPADDAQAWTELRLNAVRLEVGAAAYPLVPFLRSAVDTELTPIPAPTEGDPDAELPRQLQLLQSAGLVAFPGGWLQEIRLGALIQTDFNDGTTHNDLGATLGLQLAAPLWGPLLLTTEVDARALFPDGDDRPSDLAFQLSSLHKLILNLNPSLAVFSFLDLYLVQGKVAPTNQLGGSWIVGGGVQIQQVFRLQ